MDSVASSSRGSKTLSDPVRLWPIELPRDRVPLLVGGARCGEGGEARSPVRDSETEGVEGGEFEGQGGRGGKFDDDLKRGKFCDCFDVGCADARFDALPVSDTPLMFSTPGPWDDDGSPECAIGGELLGAVD